MAEALARPQPRDSRMVMLRPKLLDLYLVRGVAGPFLLVTAIACVAMMLERSLRLVHEMAASGAHLSYLFPLLGELLPYYIALALPAAFMIALLFLMVRLDETLQLEAMLAGGVSMARIAAPLVAFGIAVAGASIVAGGYLEPQGRYGFRALKIEAINAGRIAQLQPGAFYSPVGGLTLSVDESGGGESRGIFVRQDLGKGKELVATAQSGRVGLAGGSRDVLLELRRGLHYRETGDGSGRPFTLRFEGYELHAPLTIDDPRWQRGWDQKELTLGELIAERDRWETRISRSALDAELYSRLARSLTIPLLPLLALPLSFATERGRRGLGIVLGGAFLMAFHHGLNTAKSLGVEGRFDPRLSIGLVTALFAAFAIALFVSSRRLPSYSPIVTPLQRLARRLARARRSGNVAPRLPGRTMATYVSWTLIVWIMAAAAAIIALLQLVDMVERGDDFVRRGFGFADVGRYALLRLPAMFQQAIGMAALAGAMVAFIRLSRFSEIVAIRAAGISQFRILAMALPAALACSLASLAVAEYLAPHAQLELAYWWRSTDPNPQAGPAKDRWFRIGDDIVRATAASPDGKRLEGVTLYLRGPDRLLGEKVSARFAMAGKGSWTMVDVRSVRVGGGERPSRANRRIWRTSLESRDVRAFFAASQSVSSEAARRSLEGAVPVSAPPALFRTRLHRLAAEPLAPIVMLLFALPLALSSARTGPSWPALVYAGGGGLLYIVADGALTVAAQIGMVAPWIGAWSAPFFASLLAITVLVYTEA